MLGVNDNIPIYLYGKPVLFLVVLLLFPNHQSTLIATIKMVKHLHDVAVATVLLVEHHAKIARHTLIQCFEETFFIQRRIRIILFLGDDIFVKPLKVAFPHMAQIIHRRQLPMVSDKDYGFSVQDRYQQIEKRGF